MKLKNKIIAITGGAQGLGNVLTRACSEQGATVVILDLNEQKIEEAKKELAGEVVGFVCDVSQPDSVRAAFSKIGEQLGKLDVLINNAAIYPPFKLEKGSDKQLQSVIGVNFLGAMYCCREAIPLLKESKGDIINISSESVRLFPPMLSVYAASKAGLETFSQSLRQELATTGVRVATLRIGRMKRHDASALDEETRIELLKAFEETGFAVATGEGAEESTIASTLLSLLTLPADANIDLLEVRSRQ